MPTIGQFPGIQASGAGSQWATMEPLCLLACQTTFWTLRLVLLDEHPNCTETNVSDAEVIDVCMAPRTTVSAATPLEKSAAHDTPAPFQCRLGSPANRRGIGVGLVPCPWEGRCPYPIRSPLGVAEGPSRSSGGLGQASCRAPGKGNALTPPAHHEVLQGTPREAAGGRVGLTP